ncbi:unnamed protein product [Vicia faba]|uniref:Uncharacterized protein n=1 Tax=Vicia faba TaxID=3906 RepID=A0AAV0YNM7_VICFA|nr:unnamed protein product [Vicia faba]
MCRRLLQYSFLFQTTACSWFNLSIVTLTTYFHFGCNYLFPSLLRGPRLVLKGTCLWSLDIESEACDLIKGTDPGFEYNDIRIWWKYGDGSLEVGLKSFMDDGDAFELYDFVENCKCKVEIYTKPKPTTGDATFMENARKRNKGIQGEDHVVPCTDEGSSDESVKDIKFEDNGAGSSEAVKHSFITPEMDDNDDDDKPNVVRFNEEDGITKDFKFKALVSQTDNVQKGRPKGSLKKQHNIVKKSKGGPSLNDIDIDILETILSEINNEENIVLDIPPLKVDLSSIKPKSAINQSRSKTCGARTFFGSAPKVNPSKAFKPPGNVKETCSDPISLIIPVNMIFFFCHVVSLIIAVNSHFRQKVWFQRRNKLEMMWFIPERVKES